MAVWVISVVRKKIFSRSFSDINWICMFSTFSFQSEQSPGRSWKSLFFPDSDSLVLFHSFLLRPFPLFFYLSTLWSSVMEIFELIVLSYDFYSILISWIHLVVSCMSTVCPSVIKHTVIPWDTGRDYVFFIFEWQCKRSLPTVVEFHCRVTQQQKANYEWKIVQLDSCVLIKETNVLWRMWRWLKYKWWFP